MLKGLILGVLLGVVLIAGGVYYYFSSGRAPVATSAPPMPPGWSAIRPSHDGWRARTMQPCWDGSATAPSPTPAETARATRAATPAPSAQRDPAISAPRAKSEPPRP